MHSAFYKKLARDLLARQAEHGTKETAVWWLNYRNTHELSDEELNYVAKALSTIPKDT